ncbi:MAG TPA: hypothetical protein VGX03_10490 [Candidatus Binatia bacterium]|jgi:hypothetical protein|nr:hypothetical protein [Candidatus Binatia bacterium]
MQESHYISLSEAFKRFGPSPQTLKRKILSGELRGVRFTPKGKIFVDIKAMEALAIAVSPASPQSPQDLRAWVNAVAKEVLGEDWEQRRKQQRRTAVPLH